MTVKTSHIESTLDLEDLPLRRNSMEKTEAIIYIHIESKCSPVLQEVMLELSTIHITLWGLVLCHTVLGENQ